MEKIDFNLEGEYIELIQLLKATGIAQTGGHAKMIVDNSGVIRDGEVEERRRAKLKKGDIIEVEDAVRIELV
ncbi:MAG TPA: RNA-binding S4 domain-containing protein [Brumimicrobium sp.]|nr:RNA-binding S4 domain-containing protein [Brumimicrobium sp.]